MKHQNRKHRKTHLKDSQKPHPCPSCEKAFLYPKDLARHKSSIHDNKKGKEESSSSEFICPEEGCSRRYSRQADLNRHMAQHVAMNMGYRCMSEECPRPGKIWNRIDHLASHVRNLHKDENIQELIRKYAMSLVSISLSLSLSSVFLYFYPSLYSFPLPSLPAPRAAFLVMFF